MILLFQMIEFVKSETSIIGTVWYIPKNGRARFLTRLAFEKYKAEIIRAYSNQSYKLLDKVQGLPLVRPAFDNANFLFGFSWKSDPESGVLIPPPRQRSILRGILGFTFILVFSMWFFPHFFKSSAYYLGYLFLIVTALKVLFPKGRYRLKKIIQHDQSCSITETGLLIGIGLYYYKQITSFEVIESNSVDIFSFNITPYFMPMWLSFFYEPIYVAVPKRISDDFKIIITKKLQGSSKIAPSRSALDTG